MIGRQLFERLRLALECTDGRAVSVGPEHQLAGVLRLAFGQIRGLPIGDVEQPVLRVPGENQMLPVHDRVFGDVDGDGSLVPPVRIAGNVQADSFDGPSRRDVLSHQQSGRQTDEQEYQRGLGKSSDHGSCSIIRII